MEINDCIRQRLKKAEELHIGGVATDTLVGLSIYADELDPPAMTRLLGAEPTSSRRKGELDPERPKTGPAKIGQWRLEADGATFDAKIASLLDRTTADTEVWNSLVRSGHSLQLRTAVFLHSWTEGINLTTELPNGITQRHWEFSLSVYSAEGNEVLDAFFGLSPSDSP